MILNSNNINGAYEGSNLEKLGYSYNGSFQVLSSVINSYLFDKARTAGGYGGNVFLSEDGDIYLNTARMPDIELAFSIFNELPNYLKSFNATDRELMKYKVEAVKNIYGSQAQIVRAMQNQDENMEGKTGSDYQKELDEIMNIRTEDINKMADMISDVIKQNTYEVLGNKDKLNAKKDMFTRLIDLTK